MGNGCRAAGLALALLLLAGPPTEARAQGPFATPTRFELSDSIQLDLADAAARTHLERVEAFLANEQWDEAVETLRQVGENHGDKVIALTERRYTSLRDYCHLKLSSLPSQALELYRSRVDPQAERWYRQGIDHRDPEPLRSVVEQFFASNWGDDALYALGEIALARGDYGTARGYWERILPPAYWTGVDSPRAKANGTHEWLVYPDAPPDLVAATRARLVLLLILEGDYQTAEPALKAFEQEFAPAEGRLAGREVNYASALAELLDASRRWPEPAASPDWTTFAGSMDRNTMVPPPLDVGAPRWSAPLPETPSADVGYPRRVAEEKDQLLSYHPLLVDGLVLVNHENQIRAYDEATGGPAWGDDPVIFQDDVVRPERRRASRSTLGAPRYTMTAAGGRLYARMGSPVTSTPHEPVGPLAPGYLVCLDLRAEGRLLWRIMPPDESWAFEGSPVTDGAFVYVGLRRSDVRPQAHVACYDAQTGELRWQRMVCGAETPAQGQYEEITHNLLTLESGVLYYNTNLGAVAALNARDGHVQWVFLYPRASAGDLNQRAKHFYRDLTPCIYDRGVLYVAPADSRHILALDAATGMLFWHTDLPADAVHLLGVGGGNLLASGDKLWWIDVSTGKVANVGWAEGAWPDGPSPKGFGRGILAGDRVYWPTRTAVYVFDQRTGRTMPSIELTTRGAHGGNLLVAGGSLLIATHDELTLFSPLSGLRDEPGDQPVD